MNNDQLRTLTDLLQQAIAHVHMLPYATLMPLAKEASYLSGMLLGEIEERDETGRNLD